jgi:MFS family permease
VVGAPDIETSLGAAHAVLALVLFVAPGAIALVVEPLLFVLADRYPRRWFVRGGIAAMAIAMLAAGLAPGPITLALALGVMYFAGGTAISLGQASLVDRDPEHRARTLARWTLWSIAGDIAAPALLAALAFAGASWRAGFVLVGVLLAVWAALLSAADLDAAAPAPTEPDAADAEPRQSLLATLRDALTDRVLVAWLFGTALCDLLDEILVVFASIHVRVDLHAGPFWQSAVIGAFVGGGVVGLLVLDRLLRYRSERMLLVAASIGCVVAYIPWLAVSSPLATTLLAIPIGICAAPLYPLAAAQAYACRPNQSGSVLAASHLFTPLGLALPYLIGALADAAGTTMALTVLAAQPLGLVILVASTRVAPPASVGKRESQGTPDSTSA